MKKKTGIFNALFSRISYNCRTTVKSFTYKSTDFQIIIKWILTLFIINTLQFFKLYQLSKNACVHGPCSVMPDSATPQTCQAPLSIEFFRQEHWSGFPFPTPWDLPNPGIEPESCISCIGRQILYHCAKTLAYGLFYISVHTAYVGESKNMIL